jgi:hypothetical protein
LDRLFACVPVVSGRNNKQACGFPLPDAAFFSTSARKVGMEKLTCDECGTRFNCGAPPGKDHCWCMELPNMRQSFDLAGKCVCPDCMTLGQAKAMVRARKVKKQNRQNAAVQISRGGS